MTDQVNPPPAVTPEDIENYFDRYEWTFSRAKDEVWQTGFRGKISSFRITISLTDNWVFFVINPFVVAPSQPENRLKLYHHLLRLNHEINLAKFGIDGDGDVFLSVELPTEGFAYSHFEDALGALCHYSDAHYCDIFNLAHGEHAETGYTSELNHDDQADQRPQTPPGES